jgi:SAM-dependent methyltransferase
VPSPPTLDHIALLVRSLDDALSALAELDLTAQPVQTFPNEGTRECYLGEPSQSGRLLLIEPISDGPYADSLASRGPGLHHVALVVDDLDAFLAGVVADSGWLVHPRSFETRDQAGTVWLARPGVETLVECTEVECTEVECTEVECTEVECTEGEYFEGEDQSATGAVVEQVSVAGLDNRDGFAGLFEQVGVDVVAGPLSGVLVGGRFVSAPGEGEQVERSLDDSYEYNRQAWNRQVQDGNRWTVGVDHDEVERARAGVVEIVLTPTKVVPDAWLGELQGADVLCLASGGGQQGPLLAAAGANVTVFDASDEQLQRDREVAEREGLELRTVRGDMRDLGEFDDASFDLVVHPCSNCFVADIEPVWREAFRVLRSGGSLISGFNNPVSYCFDWDSVERGAPRLRHRLPYRDLDNLESPFVAKAVAAGEPIEFSHTLEAQLGGQIAAGFAIIGFYEDPWGTGDFPDPYFDAFIATRARK